MTATDPPDPVTPHHEGVPFGGAGALAVQLAPRLHAALRTAAPVVAVLDEAERAALGAELGAAASGIEFLDPADVYRVPAFTVAVRWARLSRRAEPGARATVVGQHVALPGGDGPGYWARLDAALDVALAGLPVEVLCPFPDGDDVLSRTTHRTLLSGGHSVPTAAFREPLEVVAEFPPPPPPDLGEPGVVLPFGLEGLGGLRRTVATVATDGGLRTERVADFVLAVNEIASNSVEHGPGSGTLRMWVTDGQVVAEVHDAGRLRVPFPGLVAPPPTGARGRGLWLASELSDVLQVWSDAGGTVIRVTMTL